MILIDGSTLEGGGQLTRLSLCLAAITCQPVRIHSIRAGRGSPSHGKDRGRDKGRSARGTAVATRQQGGGLKDSHLAALKFLAEQCNAKVTGAEVGSSEVTFRPSQSSKPAIANTNTGKNGCLSFDISLTKSGSVWLIFQAVYPYLAFCTNWAALKNDPSNEVEDQCITLKLQGGTNVSKAMSTEYVSQVFAPIAAKIGLPHIDIETVRRGWAGNSPAIGEVVIKISSPSASNLSTSNGRLILPAFTIHDRGEISKISMTVLANLTMSNSGVIDTLQSFLSQTFPGVPIETTISEDSGNARRFYILLVAHTTTGWRLGRDFLGSGALARNAAMETKMVDEACKQVVRDLESEVARTKETGCCVDQYLQDQLVVFQALSQGVSLVGKEHAQQEETPDVEKLVEKVAGLTTNDRDERVDVDEDGVRIESERIARVGDDSGTLHTRTVRWVCETMLEEHSVLFEAGGRCRGIGWNAERPDNSSSE